MRGAISTWVLALLVTPLAVVVGATPASADSATDIVMTGFRDMVVDDAHGHVFVSQGNATMIVTDLQGVPFTTIEDLHGAAGMTLSPDGTTLYVALSGGDAIAAVDTSALEVRETYPTGTASCPGDVAVTAGLVWFGSGCSSSQTLRALDPADGAVTDLGSGHYNAILRTSPALPGEIFVLDGGISPTTIYAYTARGGDSPSLSLRTSRRNTGSNAQDLAITPDGSKLIQASGYPYVHNAYRTTDLSSAGSYGSDTYPNAVAVRDDGLVAAGISGWYEPDVYLYKPGWNTLHQSYEFGGTANELLPGGLAFGTLNLYAVTADLYDRTGFVLRVITPVGVPRLLLRTDKSTYTAGDTAHVTATLVTESPNQTVSIYSVIQGEQTLLASGPVDEVAHELTTDLEVTEPTRFLAVYAGDEEVSSSSASKDVDVQLRSSTVTMTADKPSYRYGEMAELTVRLNTPSSNRRVVVSRVVDGDSTQVKVGEVPLGGALRLGVRVWERSQLRVTYEGGEGTRGSSARVTVPVAARVSTRVVGSEGQRGRYHLYDAGDRARLFSSVSPNHAGECLYFRVQFLKDGFFRDDEVTGCLRMDAASDATKNFPTTREARGQGIRVRGEWRGDRRSMRSVSDWRYIRFT